MTEDRVDGRALEARDEPGSDALLLFGLIALLGRLQRVLNHDDEES